MRKEAKLSRVPAEDEESANVPVKFLGMAFDVTRPASQADEIDWKWTQFSMPMKELYRNSLAYKTVPTLKRSARNAVTKCKFMLSMTDQPWVFNWSKAQRIMEINVAKTPTKAKARRLGAFAIGIMLYDFGIKPASRNYFARKVKRENIQLDGIQKFLKFLKDGMALGRPRAAFAFGFMMHMEQVSKALRGHPLHGMVGEILFDTETFDSLSESDRDTYTRFEIDEDAPLNYQFAPERFDSVLNGMDDRQIRELKGKTWGGHSFEDAFDMTGIAPFQNALKNNLIKIVKDPTDEKHREVVRGLGLSDPSELKEDNFFLALTQRDGADYDTNSRNIYSSLYYRPNGRNNRSGEVRISQANRTGIQRDTHYNDLVYLKEAFRGTGAAMHMTTSQIETGLRLKRKTITVWAALNGGWKTWGQFGFESDAPFLSEAAEDKYDRREVHVEGKVWAKQSVTNRLYEMGSVDKQEIMKDLVKEMISDYNLQLASSNQPVPPPPRPTYNMPPDPTSDVLKIMMFVLRAHSSYSDKMKRVLRDNNLPESTDARILQQWYSMNTVTKAQQEAVHKYFKDVSGMRRSFRQQWGYPASDTPTRQQRSSTVDTWLTHKITEWDWFKGQPFNRNSVISLVGTPQFDVVFGLTNLEETVAWLQDQQKDERSSVLKQYRLTPESQMMQDCMDCEGFNKWWKGWADRGRNPNWHGTVDLTDGKYSLAVLAMDQYRKLKLQEKPELASDPAYQRSRFASVKDSLKGVIDYDILESMDGSEVDGGISAVDMAFMEMGLRKAHQIRKDLKKQTPNRIASRWLGEK